jgi:hypothetical protein
MSVIWACSTFGGWAQPTKQAGNNHVPPLCPAAAAAHPTVHTLLGNSASLLYSASLQPTRVFAKPWAAAQCLQGMPISWRLLRTLPQQVGSQQYRG